MKWISYYPGNTARGFPDSSGLIVLNDPDHGHPVAILEGMWITLVRTAACGAVAARHCARPEPARLGLVGCGGLGKWSLRVLSALFPSLSDVFVASRTRESREEFCAAMADEGLWTLTPAASVEDAVRDMDIVVSSIPQGSERPLKADWWTEGMLAIPLDILTAWDDEAFEAIDMLVADNDAGAESRSGAAGGPISGCRTNSLPSAISCSETAPAAGATGIASWRYRRASGASTCPSRGSIYRRAREAGIGTAINLLS